MPRLLGGQQTHAHALFWVTGAAASASPRQCPLAHVSIRQHTPAYVRIRPHTSAYVSTRQHTSAYLRMLELLVVVLKNYSKQAHTRFHHTRPTSIRQRLKKKRASSPCPPRVYIYIMRQYRRRMTLSHTHTRMRASVTCVSY